MKRARFLALVGAAAVTVCLTPWHAAQAGGYPDHPVRIIVPYVAGGNLDLTARLFGQELSKELGQPFVIENRPGANGDLGTEYVARSAPDGYTLEMVSAGTLTINPSLYKNMGFDPEKDLAPISIVSTGPMVLEVNNELPVHNMAELVAYAKAHPGKLNFGSGGNGTLAHLSAEMLRARAGINIVHVPYKGTSLATNDVIAGHIQAMFDTLSTAAPLIREGKLRAIAVASNTRSSAFPDLPTIAESGLEGVIAEAWAGLVAPAGTPPAVVSKLQAAVVKIAASEQMKTRLAGVGSEPVGSSSIQFASAIRDERARWGGVVRVSGAHVD